MTAEQENFFGLNDEESIYSKKYIEEEEFREFVQYLSDKNITLAIVKCS